MCLSWNYFHLIVPDFSKQRHHTSRKEVIDSCFIHAMLSEAVFTMIISIRLDNELENRIQRLAGTTRHRSLHWIIREAIREYVEREEAIIEQFEQEALASWESYEETGQHLTGQEIYHWLDTWGADKETVVPPCHK